MQAYRLEATLTQDSTLVLQSLPLQAGETVEIIILVKTLPAPASNPYPLRDTPVAYLHPAEPVAQGDWEAAQ